MDALDIVLGVAYFVAATLATAALLGRVEERWEGFTPTRVVGGIAISSNTAPRPRRGARPLSLRKLGIAGGGPLRVVLATAAFVLILALPAAIRPCPDGGCKLTAMIHDGEHGLELFDRTGRSLGYAGHRYITLAELPPYVPALALAVEDRRFYGHRCIDPKAVLRAAVNTARGRREGASTVCMQAVRALDHDHRIRPQRTWPGKVAQTRLALELYVRTGFDKDRILTMYLNNVYLGQLPGGEEIRGIEDAAWTFFGKPARALTLAEAATLIGMIQQPNNFDPRRSPRAVMDRRATALRLLGEFDPKLATAVQSAAGEPLGTVDRAHVPHEAVRALQLAAYLPQGRATRGPVYTTLDLGAQEIAERVRDRLIRRIESGEYGRYQPPTDADNRLQAAAFLLDAQSGALLAYSCGRADTGRLESWDLCRRGRIAVASVGKIALTMMGIETGIITSETTLAELERRAGNPHLRSAEHRQFRREATLDRSVRSAFAASDNYLALLLLEALPEPALADLRSLGFAFDRRLPASALGTGTMPPLQMAAVTAAIVNGGRLPTLHISAGQHLLESPGTDLGVRPQTLAILRDLMQGVVDHGTAAQARESVDGTNVGAKTGTTQDLDARIIGWRLTEPEALRGAVALVWVGHPTPHPLFDNLDAGRLLAGPWAEVLMAAEPSS